MKTVGEEDHPVYVTKDYGLFCVAIICKLCNSCSVVDLWMSRTGVDTFYLVVNFIDSNWEPRHKIVRIFEASNTA